MNGAANNYASSVQPQPPMRPGAPGSKNALSKLTGWCSNNGSICLAIIVVLVIIIVYQYMVNKGYFGLGKKKKSSMKGSRRSKGSTGDDDELGGDVEDPATARLIDDINTA